MYIILSLMKMQEIKIWYCNIYSYVFNILILLKLSYENMDTINVYDNASVICMIVS